jgi:hypothetical protein
MTYVLLNLAAFGGIIIFMYLNRNSTSNKEILNELGVLRDKNEHLQHRVEILEAIIADKDFDAFSTSETSSESSKRQRTD